MSEKTPRVLVIGSGGREHAIVWALRQTSLIPIDVYCVPGNDGIAELAKCEPIPLTEHHAIIAFAKTQEIDLSFVGPEGPLADGIVDRFLENGLAVAGPSAAAARLEASKIFAKDFMSRHQIPTAFYRLARSGVEANEILDSGAFGDANHPVVLKADGLAAGKGVVVASSHDEAKAAAADLLSGRLVGPQAADRILIEQALIGVEASVLIFCDGKDYRIMPPARDHKRIGENDVGPNTGGMGAITDDAVLEASALSQIAKEIIEPTLRGAQEEGFPYRGILFIGIMLTDQGPKVLEYNVRFGDPETQAILVRLKSSLFGILSAISAGTLGHLEVNWSPESSACVVLASEGYPGRYESGLLINGLDESAGSDNVQLFHAGTTKSETGEWKTAGGRVLGVTATGGNLTEALAKCYGTVSRIGWSGMQYRRDIGKFRAAVKDEGG